MQPPEGCEKLAIDAILALANHESLYPCPSSVAVPQSAKWSCIARGAR